MSRKAQIFTKNDTLALLLKQAGIETVTELARRCQTHQPPINNAVNGKREAIFGVEPGTYRLPAIRIAEALGVLPEVIFGEDPLADEKRRHAEEVFLESSNNDLIYPISPEHYAVQASLKETIERVLSSLTPREERVLRMRFGIGMNTDHTLEDVGQQFSITRERIREIETRALRKLRHPNRTRQAARA
jgi:RNA polymerase sigma factor (sigma-70 family)